MSNPKIVDSMLIQQLLLENHNIKSINEKLLSLGWDDESILKCVSEFKKVKNARRQTTGTIYLIIGAFLGFVSCVLAIVNPIPELHSWFLFGFTFIAVVLILYGLYNIFE